MNYRFILREDDGSGYRIDCRFNREAAIEFAASLLVLDSSSPTGDSVVRGTRG